MARRRTYLISIVLSAGFVLVSPLALFTIFLSGDSCCGENTTGTMLGVTAVIVVLITIVAALLNGLAKLAVKRDDPEFRLRTATLITAGPVCAICVAFVLVIAATAF